MLPSLVAGLLAAGLGCSRTTSIGRATEASDAAANGDTSRADAQADRGIDAAADRDPTPAADARADAPVDGPIIGNGRDAATDAPDAPDAPADADNDGP